MIFPSLFRDDPLFVFKLSVMLEEMLQLFHVIKKENAYIRKNIHYFALLTDKEKVLIVFLMKGYDIKSIAEICRVKENTVKTHFRNVRRKLNIGNDVDLEKFAKMFNII